MANQVNFHREPTTQLSSSFYRAQIYCLVRKVYLKVKLLKVSLQSLFLRKKNLKSHFLLLSFRLRMIMVWNFSTFTSTWRPTSGLNLMILCFSQECISSTRKVILSTKTSKILQYLLCNKLNFSTV